MNTEEMVEFFEKYNVPYIDNGGQLAMTGWGDMPRHLQEKMKHQQRTGGHNRAERRGNRAKDRVKGKVRT